MGVTMPDAGEETAGINNGPAGINNAQSKYSAEVNPRVPTSDLISAEQDLHVGYEMSLRFLLEKNLIIKELLIS